MPGPGGGLLLEGMSAPGGSTPGGGGAWSGRSAPGGGGAWSGGGIPACTEADPPVNRITHACENITLPQLRCGR